MPDDPKPKDRTPIVVQAGWDDWNQFAVDLACDRANDNAKPERKWIPEPFDPEMDKALSGLLKPAPKENLLQKIMREQRERIKRIAQGVEQPGKEQERGLDLDDDRRW